MTAFEQNNHIIHDIGSQEEWTPEDLDLFATAVAENVAVLLTNQPLTEEQAQAVNEFLS